MIYLQPITFWAIVRDLSGTHSTEIAEHPDGAMKAYTHKWQAEVALREMHDRETWQIREILMVPPPMTEAARREAIQHEIDQSIGRRR